MCYVHDKTLADAPSEFDAKEAAAWLRGVEDGFDLAMDWVSERDAEEDA